MMSVGLAYSALVRFFYIWTGEPRLPGCRTDRNRCIVRAGDHAGVIEMSDWTALSRTRPLNTVPHLYERTVELYLNILDMQAEAETVSPSQLRSLLREAEQVVAGLIRKEADTL